MVVPNETEPNIRIYKRREKNCQLGPCFPQIKLCAPPPPSFLRSQVFLVIMSHRRVSIAIIAIRLTAARPKFHHVTNLLWIRSTSVTDLITTTMSRCRVSIAVITIRLAASASPKFHHATNLLSAPRSTSVTDLMIALMSCRRVSIAVITRRLTTAVRPKSRYKPTMGPKYVSNRPYNYYNVPSSRINCCDCHTAYLRHQTKVLSRYKPTMGPKYVSNRPYN